MTYLRVHICIYIQDVPKPMSPTSPGYFPPLIKQKSSYQHGSKSEQVLRYLLTFMYGHLWVLHKMFEWTWERICLFPADVALCAKMFGYMGVDDSEMVLDTDALPHVQCHWHDRRWSECLPSQRTCSLWAPSWIKYKYPLQLLRVEYI